MKTIATAILCVSLLTPTTEPPATGETRDARALIEAAQQAMTAERFDQAMDLYGQAGALMPDTAEIPFNMGVAAYRAGELERASELFDAARTLAADPSMQAQSAYNLGTTSAKQALQSKMEDPAVAQAQMESATESLKTALERFRDTIAMNPDDEDARANGELAWRWLKQLEDLQDQMQPGGQQQPEEGDQDQDQQQPDGEPQEGEQGQDQQQDQDQQQPSEQDQQQEQEQDQQQGADDQQEQDDEQESPTTGEQEKQEQQQRQGTPDKESMSREEAERLLQSVRDKEAQRRAELARREARGQRPVDKDW